MKFFYDCQRNSPRPPSVRFRCESKCNFWFVALTLACSLGSTWTASQSTSYWVLAQLDFLGCVYTENTANHLLETSFVCVSSVSASCCLLCSFIRAIYIPKLRICALFSHSGLVCGRTIGPSRFESCLYLCDLLLLSNEACYRERAGRLRHGHGK